MSFLNNVKSEKTREMYKKAIKHFTLKKMDKNDDSDYDYLINEYEQVINILKTLSDANLKKYSDCFHFVVHYLTNFSEKTRDEYSIMYKKITAEADKQVRIKKHPLKKQTIPTNIFEVKEEHLEENITHDNPVIENNSETRKSKRILEKKENKNIYKKEEKEEKKSTFRIIKKVQHNNVEDELEDILKQMKKRKVTTKNYRYKIKQFVREYNANVKNLDFLVTDSKNIVHYLTTNNFHRDTIVGFYSPIVKLIYYLPFDVSEIDKAYNNYKEMLDSLPKHSEYPQRTPEYYGNYDWIKLRNKLHDISKTEKNDETKLLIALYMDQPPRRSSDYANCIINKPDDGIHNILQFTKDKKQFIFNDYKNIVKTGKQIQPIVNEQAINSIKNYINKHKDNTYLFENEFGEPLTETQIVTKIHGIAKKYNLKGAFSINSMRHLLANLLDDKDYSDKQIREVAKNMGTSIDVIKRNYTDKKDTGFDVDVLDEPKQKWVKKE